MFTASKLKAQRAEKHILELHSLMQSFASSPDVYSVSIETESQYRDPELAITVRKTNDELRSEAALIIGDVYHNLRSALDMLWFEIVSSTRRQNRRTAFPIAATREILAGRLAAALSNRQITTRLRDFVLDTIKPYKEGNFRIWAVHEMNIIDKHRLLIRNFPVIAVEGIRVQNDEGTVLEIPILLIDASSFRRSLSQIDRSVSFGRNPALADKGHAALGFGFDLGNPHPGDPVVPTLNAAAKEVTGTIGAFESLLDGSD